MKTRRYLITVTVLIAILAGCASGPKYGDFEGSAARGQYADAAKALEASAQGYGDNSRLLYLMDKGMALHLAGEYQASNQSLETANQLIEDLYTKSISKEALSFMVNDYTLSYLGEDFERVMLHVVGMLNYVFLGQVDEALVEARRADQRLGEFAERYGDKAIYREDALARYISAALYEMKGEYSDAYIDYKKARLAFGQYSQAYGTVEPAFLGGDLLRLAAAVGGSQELEALKRDYPLARSYSLRELEKEKGEVLVLLFDGWAPVKDEYFITVPVDRLFFKMAFPRFVKRPLPVLEARLSLEGTTASGPMELIEPLDEIAVHDLDARLGRIRVKAIARATAKFIANRKVQQVAEDSGNGLASLLAFLGTNIYTLATEQADKRSWRTLPGRIHLARLALAPGTYDLAVEMRTLSGSRVKEFKGVKVTAGKKVFLRTTVY